MPTKTWFHGSLLLTAIAIAAVPAIGAETAAATAPTAGTAHDFDYLAGRWKIHLHKLARPLSGSKEWIDADGTVTCRYIFGGTGEVEEFDVENPAQSFAIHGLAIRLFNPATHRWSIYWADAKKGAMDAVPQVGGFSGEQGQFLAHDTYEGKPIVIRFSWTKIHTATPHFEQAFSSDDGKTWEVNWVTDQTRVDPTEK